VSGNANGAPRQESAEDPGPGPGRKWTTALVALVLVFVGLASYDLISGGVASAGRPSASRTAGSAVPRATVAASARSAAPAPSPGRSSTSSPGPSATSSPGPSATSSPAPGAVTVSLLTVASAAAYGPDGTSDGDHPDLAPGIINGGDGQAWHSSWYTSPEFGNLQSGTGLLLDMGETVTVSSLRLVLGGPVGADVQVRVGDTSLLAELPVAATAYDVGGTVRLPVTTPASGRYVLIWFTQLPPDSPGKYQASVYSAAVYGAKGTLFAALGTSHRAKTMRSVVIQLRYRHDDCGAWRFGHTEERRSLLRRATARLCTSVPWATGRPASGRLDGAAE
jgi:hypothetical protein